MGFGGRVGTMVKRGTSTSAGRGSTGGRSTGARVGRRGGGGRRKLEPCWVPCKMCFDWVCVKHDMLHVYDCPCPSIEVWAEAGVDPYMDEPYDGVILPDPYERGEG